VTDYPGLTPAHLPIHPTVETSQRFVAAAYDSVAEFVIWHESAVSLALDAEETEHELADLTRN
jgi:hypothetical protein